MDVGKPRIAFFAHDATDAAVVRRVRSLTESGSFVTLFSFERRRYRSQQPNAACVVRLGKTRDGHYVTRAIKMAWALQILCRRRSDFRACERIYARNLDMALLAVTAMVLTGCRRPLSYEVLDVQDLFFASGVIAAAVRALERWLLRLCDILVLSSPGFMEGYYRPIQGYSGQWALLENKLSCYQVGAVSRPSEQSRRVECTPRPWRMGWFGTMRSERGLVALVEATLELGGLLEVEVRGIWHWIGAERATEIIGHTPFVKYYGPYDATTDLVRIYSPLHLMWCMDLVDQGHNGALLLPNRLYEAGFFGTPTLVPEKTYAGRYVTSNRLGWALEEPTPKTICGFFRSLTFRSYNSCVERILRSPCDQFLGDDQLQKLIARWQFGRSQ